MQGAGFRGVSFYRNRQHPSLSRQNGTVKSGHSVFLKFEALESRLPLSATNDLINVTSHPADPVFEGIDRSGFTVEMSSNDDVGTSLRRSGFGVGCRNYIAGNSLITLGPDFISPRTYGIFTFSPFDFNIRSDAYFCFEVSSGYQAWTDITLFDIVVPPDYFPQVGVVSLQLLDRDFNIIDESGPNSVLASVNSDPQIPLQAGEYYLRVVNHTPDVLFSYSLRQFGVVGEVEVAFDRFEPNDTRQTATDLQTISGSLSVADLSIHTASDFDFFKFTTTGVGTSA
ncbi:MAG TPA: hypothetical protein DDZ51_14725, partial [Planctomycetaceae bacterium]|nr:hypothetical protein [Planctomycetaceae bacterium]